MKFLAFLKRDFLMALSYKLPFMMQLLGIFFSVFIFYYVSLFVNVGKNGLLEKYGGSYFTFLLVGIAFSDFFLTSTNSFAEEIRKGQLFGTLEALLTTPLSAVEILLYSSSYNYCFSAVRLLAYFIFGSIFLPLPIIKINFLLVSVVFLLSLLSFWGIGMLSASFVMVFKQSSPIKWLLGSATGLLGGVFYPKEVLPDSLKIISNLLPITHAVEALRLTLLNRAGLGDIWHQIIALFFLSSIIFPLGIYSFKFGLKVAKQNGSLLHY